MLTAAVILTTIVIGLTLMAGLIQSGYPRKQLITYTGKIESFDQGVLTITLPRETKRFMISPQTQTSILLFTADHQKDPTAHNPVAWSKLAQYLIPGQTVIIQARTVQKGLPLAQQLSIIQVMTQPSENEMNELKKQFPARHLPSLPSPER